MNKTITFLLATLLWFSGSASAAIYTVENEDFNILVPGDEIAFSTTLQPGIPFTFGFGVTDPAHYLDLLLEVPDSMTGYILWTMSSESYGNGQLYDYGELFPGDTEVFHFGAVATATAENPDVTWLTYFLLNGETDTVVPTAPVPEVPVPAAVWLFGSGLLGLVGVARRRKELK